ncbi:NAD-dependent epimerase/dehydratase family protein [Dyella jiangningensis]
MKRVLLCGGAGYIGSHMAKMLAGHGHAVTVLDNLSTGHRSAVQWGTFIEADLLDAAALDNVFGAARFDAVMHFSAYSLVDESVRQPYRYYENNVGGALNLLQAMQRHGVGRLVFSSTASVYGNPAAALIDEDHAKAPINPYGMSKLMVERMLADAAAAYGLRSVALRYFNAAGASEAAEIGEAHQPETHLIPNVLKAVLAKARASRFLAPTTRRLTELASATTFMWKTWRRPMRSHSTTWSVMTVPTLSISEADRVSRCAKSLLLSNRQRVARCPTRWHRVAPVIRPCSSHRTSTPSRSWVGNPSTTTCVPSSRAHGGGIRIRSSDAETRAVPFG